MIDRNGKEMTMTYTVEKYDGSFKSQVVLSDEATMEEILEMFHGLLIQQGWQQSTILEGMYDYATARMEISNCYNDDYERCDYKTIYHDGQSNMHYEMVKFANENPVSKEEIEGNEDKFLNIKKYDEYRRAKRSNNYED